MRQFNLDEFLKNPDRKVITRNNIPVRILCTDRNGDFPIVALVPIDEYGHRDNSAAECIYKYTKDGKISKFESSESIYDLFFKPISHIRYINIYAHPNNWYCTASELFETEEAAQKVGVQNPNYLKTISIEWED